MYVSLAGACVGFWAYQPAGALAEREIPRHRLETREQVARLLDAGEPEQVGYRYRQILQDRTDPGEIDQLKIAPPQVAPSEITAVFVQASLWLCPRQQVRAQITAMKEFAARAGNATLLSYRNGAELQADWRFREAAGPYIEAVSASSQAGDSLSLFIRPL